MQNALLKILINAVLPALTPALRNMLVAFVRDFAAHARTTENRLDDLVAGLLLELVGANPEDGLS